MIIETDILDRDYEVAINQQHSWAQPDGQEDLVYTTYTGTYREYAVRDGRTFVNQDFILNVKRQKRHSRLILISHQFLGKHQWLTESRETAILNYIVNKG